MKLKKHIFTSMGDLLLSKETILTDKYIRKLIFFQIAEIEIEEDLYEMPTTKDAEIYDEAFISIKEVMGQVSSNEKIDEELIKEAVTCIVDHIMDDPSAFMQLTGIRDKDNYTFLHCVDVCIFAVITGKNLDLPREVLIILGTAALLHDIGKSNVPDHILFKPDTLTKEEFDIIKKHTIDGYTIIKEKTNLGNLIATIALHHHEKWDGSGYPFGLKERDIHRYARIVTICDIYDALTADRVYKKKLLPHVAAEYIVANSNTILDPDLTRIFIENITIYPIGVKVILNTGEIGEVIKIDRSMPYRPKIRVLNHIDENKSIEPYCLDLIKNPNIFINEVI